MENRAITVTVQMDRKILRSFALFDNFYLKRLWIRPAVFGLIFAAFATAAFLAKDRAQHALLGAVLLAVGLGMPAVYVGMYLSQVKAQAKKLRLPRKAYTVRLNHEKITITNEIRQQDDVTLEWGKVARAFRVKNAVYLYATRTHAFVLPDGQADASPDEVWALIEESLPAGRAVNKRR